MKNLIYTIIIAIGTIVPHYAHAQIQEFYDSECGCMISDNFYDTGVLSSRKKTWKEENKVQEFSFYPDRSLQMERNWKDGKLHGTSSHYHVNGNLYYQEHYNLGEPVGTWNFLDMEGDMNLSIEHLENAEKSRVYTYYSAGVPYFTQTIEQDEVKEEKILNEEIYQAKKEEQEALRNAKK